MSKPFKETKAFEILKGVVPGIATDALAGIPIVGPAIKSVLTQILGKAKTGEVKLTLEQEETLRQQLLEIEKLENEDRKDARSREVELGKAGVKNYTQNWLAFIGVLAFFAMVGYLLIRGMKNMTTEESFIVGNVTGIVGSIATGIYAYYFGSSKGSKENGDAIRKKLEHGS